MHNIKIKLGVAISLLLFLIACSPTAPLPEKQDEEGIQVITSIFPMYEITKAVVGNRADVSLMVGANEDAHHYEPSAQAVASVNEADLFIYSSNEMEFWADSLLNVVENESLKVIELGASVDFTFADPNEAAVHHDHDDPHHHHGGIDPHFWLNPVAINEQLDTMVEVLSEVDAGGAETYRKNADAFSKQLMELDKAYQDAFKDALNRDFVVQHQAFGHLADEYDLHQVAVGGLSTEVEPDPKKLADIVDFVNEQDVPVIYYQSGENSAIAETIANETGTEIAVLYDLESVPVNDNKETLTYLEAMYENLDQLKRSIH